MAEPASSSVVGVAIAAGTITFTGSFLGVQYDALLAGFFGGLMAFSYLPPMTRWRIAGTLATSALLAGFFAPVLAAAAVNYLPWLKGLADFTRLAVAAALGVFAQPLLSAVPTIISRVSGKVGAP
jgi:hypothetical protein